MIQIVRSGGVPDEKKDKVQNVLRIFADEAEKSDCEF